MDSGTLVTLIVALAAVVGVYILVKNRRSGRGEGPGFKVEVDEAPREQIQRATLGGKITGAKQSTTGTAAPNQVQEAGLGGELADVEQSAVGKDEKPS